MKKIAFSLLMVALAGCLTDPIGDGSDMEPASPGGTEVSSEPIHHEAVIDLTDGADRVWQFTIGEDRPESDVEFTLRGLDGNPARQNGDYCLRAMSPSGSSSEGPACSSASANTQAGSPAGLGPKTLLHWEEALADGEYRFRFEAAPQLNELVVSLVVAD